MRITTFITMLLLTCSTASAQTMGITQTGVATNQPQYPIYDYTELPDPEPANEALWHGIKGWNAAWGDTDTRYRKHRPPTALRTSGVTIDGWKGEKISAQAVVWTSRKVEQLTMSVGDLTDSKGNRIAASNVETAFVRYVITDAISRDGRGGCGERVDKSLFDSLLVADVIDPLTKSMAMQPHSVRPLWISLRIPNDTPAGIYKWKVTITADAETINLPLQVKVIDRQLPQPSQWKFHLDLWQNPFAVARYYKVPLWSDAHEEAMKPLLKMLADAGQKTVTASLMHKPWGGQTEDYFETMVTWTRKVDGTWHFDFDIFDKWVEMCQSQGLDGQISCYSMVPWRLSFQYFDQATNSLQSINTAPGEKQYDEMWSAMLTAFARHLRQKGWLDRCVIAMDEREMEVMKHTLALIRRVEPKFKVSLAGNYHPQLEAELYDYCIPIGQQYPEGIVEKRKQEGKVTTIYTCCTEEYPNTFTMSEPAEAAWIGYHTAARNLDGYLRWAYNSWVKEPLLDSRFRAWAGGDTYLVYPGARSSIRMERLIEGIQAFEKIRMLRDESTQKGNMRALRKIDRMLSTFRLSDLPQNSTAETVRKARAVINGM